MRAKRTLPLEDNTIWRWHVGWWKALTMLVTVAIFSTIACTSPNRVNASSMRVLKLVDEHAMVAPIGGANEDGDDGICHGAL
jgi:hypothetical protein